MRFASLASFLCSVVGLGTSDWRERLPRAWTFPRFFSQAPPCFEFIEAFEAEEVGLFWLPLWLGDAACFPFGVYLNSLIFTWGACLTLARVALFFKIDCRGFLVA